MTITSNAMILSARPLSLVTPERRDSTATPFMSSSNYGVNFIDENNATEGTYYVGIAAQEIIDDKNTTNFTVISSSFFVDESLLSTFASVSNKNIFMNVINSSFDGTNTVVTIPARTAALEINTVTNSTMWGLFFAVMTPAIFIIAGFVFWTQRRKR